MTSLMKVPIANVKTNPRALREVNRDSAEFAEMVESMRIYGVLTPVTVRPFVGEGGAQVEGVYELVDGLHRFTAATEAGLQELPVHVLPMDDTKLLYAQLVANVHKVETRHVDYANQLRRVLQVNTMMTERELAQQIGKSTQWVEDRLSLNKISNPRIKKAINDGEVNLVKALALAKLSDEDQLDFLERAMVLPADQFVPLAMDRVKAVKEAKKTGAVTADLTYKPIPHLRKLSQIQAELATPTEVIPLLQGVTDIVVAAQRTLEYVLSLDAPTIAAAQAKFEADKKAVEDKRKARQVAAAQKKQERAMLASKEAENAAAELEGKPLPHPEVRELLKSRKAANTETEA